MMVVDLADQLAQRLAALASAAERAALAADLAEAQVACLAALVVRLEEVVACLEGLLSASARAPRSGGGAAAATAPDAPSGRPYTPMRNRRPPAAQKAPDDPGHWGFRLG
jgi:hypothetical protein